MRPSFMGRGPYRGGPAPVQATGLVHACGTLTNSLMCQLADTRIGTALRYYIGHPQLCYAPPPKPMMPPLRRTTRDDPYADETIRQVGERAPLGLLFFVV